MKMLPLARRVLALMALVVSLPVAATPQIRTLSAAPLQFEATGDGQYRATGPGYAVTLAATSARLALPASLGSGAQEVSLRLVGARADARLAASGAPASTVTRFDAGGQPHAQARHAKLLARRVWPGIDLAWYGNPQQLESDFIVAPHADPARIRLHFDGADDLAVDGSGALRIRTEAGDLFQHRPVAYQQIAGQRVAREAHYVLHAGNDASIVVSGWDSSLPLVVDPVLSYASYFGGNGEERLRAVAVDASGAIYVGGETGSAGFPSSDAPASGSLFVSKLAPDGQSILYTVYLQPITRRGDEQLAALAVDAQGNAYATGTTCSPAFPVVRAFQPSLAGRCDAFVAKIAPAGDRLIYASYLGGQDDTPEGPGTALAYDHGAALVLDPAGRVTVAGDTDSINFPTTPDAAQPALGSHPDLIETGAQISNGFITRLSPDGALEYSTYYAAGQGRYPTRISGLARDGAGNLFFTGDIRDLFDPRGGDSVVAASLGAASNVFHEITFGGDLDGHRDSPIGIATDGAGIVYVASSTESANHGSCSGFAPYVQRYTMGPELAFNHPGASSLPCIANQGNDILAQGLAVTPQGEVYLAGTTEEHIPLVDPLQAQGNGGADAFLIKLDRPGNIAFSTYLGGSGDDAAAAVAADRHGNAVVAGRTTSADFPLAGPLQPIAGGGGDGLLFRIDSTPVCDPGLVGLAADAVTVLETAGQARLQVPRSRGSCGAVSVRYDVLPTDSRARPGRNYRRVRGQLTWPDGDSSPRTILLPVLQDGLYARTGFTTVQLQAPVGTVVAREFEQVFIANTDPRPTVTLKPSDRQVSGPASVNLVAQLSRASGVETQVLLHYSGTAVAGSDYRFPTDAQGAAVRGIVIPAGQVTGKLSLQILAPPPGAATRQLEATIRAVSGADPTGLTANTFTLH